FRRRALSAAISCSASRCRKPLRVSAERFAYSSIRLSRSSGSEMSTLATSKGYPVFPTATSGMRRPLPGKARAARAEWKLLVPELGRAAELDLADLGEGHLQEAGGDLAERGDRAGAEEFVGPLVVALAGEPVALERALDRGGDGVAAAHQ